MSTLVLNTSLIMGIVFIVIIALVLFFLLRKKKKPDFILEVNNNIRLFLRNNVEFYREIDDEEKVHFEKRIKTFLETTRITGIETTISLEDRLLVAASAVIPVFAFPNWNYVNLNEVLIYPGAFSETFSTDGNDNRITGMVGSGTMEGKMILSKPALHAGFDNANDKKNVGIHEFVHLIDKSDGVIDGIPSALLNKQYTIPWLSHIQKEMDEIHAQNSDVNSYGGVSKEEFFPVISEYFFERPKLLKKKHPELYGLLNEIFTVDLAKRYKGIQTNKTLGRNDLCLCGSGKKYKHCCLKNNT